MARTEAIQNRNRARTEVYTGRLLAVSPDRRRAVIVVGKGGFGFKLALGAAVPHGRDMCGRMYIVKADTDPAQWPQAVRRTGKIPGCYVPVEDGVNE